MAEGRREYLRNYQLTWMRNRREKWLQENGPCRHCGSWERLEVDHVDPSQKITNRVWSWAKEKREAELRKCQILCHACHLRKTAKENHNRFFRQRGQPKKLNSDLVMEIYKRSINGESPTALGREYMIAHSTVIGIRDGVDWSWLTGASEKKRISHV